MRYVALRDIKMPDESVVPAGEIVPCAEDWCSLRLMIETRRLEAAPDGPTEPDTEPDTEPGTEPDTELDPAPDDPPDPLQILRDALAETRDDASSHTKTELLELADAADVERPDPVPRLKVELIEALEGGL